MGTSVLFPVRDFLLSGFALYNNDRNLRRYGERDDEYFSQRNISTSFQVI
jgi:hypothetical protein